MPGFSKRSFDYIRQCRVGLSFLQNLTIRAKGSLLVICWLAMPACTWTAGDGTRHTLVVGLGIISSKSVGPNIVTVTRSTSMGFNFRTGSPSGFVFGYQNLQQTQIAPGWCGTLTVTSKPGASLVVSASPVAQKLRVPGDSIQIK